MRAVLPNLMLAKVTCYTVFHWPTTPFIISLLYDHPHSFGSQQFAYKKLWLLAYCLQLCTHSPLTTCLQLDPGSDEAVKELRIANDDASNERYIYAATESRVYRLPLQRCSRLQGCK